MITSTRITSTRLAVVVVMVALVELLIATAANAQVASSAANPNVATQRVVPDASGSTPGLGRTGLSPVGPATGPSDNKDLVTAPGQESKAQASDAVKIRVKRIEIAGLSGLRVKELRRLVAPYEDTQVTLGQLRKLTQRIGNALRAKGYFLARASLPPQEIDRGIVKIVVSEGHYGRVSIEGNQHYSDEFIRLFFAPAMDGGVVRARQLERALLVMGDFTDLRVKANFRPGQKAGETDLVLQVQDRTPFHVGLDYDNFGNRLVGRNRAGVSMWAGSVAAEGDEIFLRVVEPFPSDSDPIYQAGYTIPVGARGTRIGAQATRAKTRVGGEFAPLDLRGDAQIYSLLVHRPAERMLRRVNTFHLGLHAKTIRNFVFGNTISSQDDLREITLGYDGYQLYDDGTFGHATVITQGLGSTFGGTPNGDPLASRAFAGNGFTKLGCDIYRTYRVGRTGTLLARGAVQVADRPLVTAEQFGVGGPDSVRGFIQSEFLGDDGYFASVEYRHPIFDGLSRDLKLAGVAFLDHGGARLRHPLPGQDSSNDLTGGGVGMRATHGTGTTARIDLGMPLSVDRNVQGDQAMLYGQMVTRF